MKKVILKINHNLPPIEFERIEEQFRKDLHKNGFIVVGPDVDVIEFDDGKMIIEVEDATK